MIRLKYFNKYPNIGDRLSVEICKKYFSKNIIGYQNEQLKKPNLILIGSILEWADQQSFVCGAGFIKQTSQLGFLPKSVSCVRGPLTASILEKQGVGSLLKYGDPGLLIKFLYEKVPQIKYQIGVIPHYVDKDIIRGYNFTSNDKVSIIDVFLSPEEFSVKVKECEIIISSSLHGLVVAHAYGIPALWVEFSNNVIGDGFKFYDYYLSVGVLPENVIRLPVVLETDIFHVCKFADVVNINSSVSMLEEAIFDTVLQLSDNI